MPRWLPAAALAALTAVVLSRFGVSARDIAVFAAYVALCLVVPGTLLVRALHRGERTLTEELSLGLAAGYAVEVLAYVAARWAGTPLMVLAWPAATYAAFAAVPRLRRHWRRPASLIRQPRWCSWGLALILAYAVAWSAVSVFRRQVLTWPGLGGSNIDMPYHLALIGELKHHMPPNTPNVAGEPLLYHWFAYAHMAAASWVTGVEPLVLLYRLAMLPVIAGLVVLVAMTGRRVTGSAAAGLAAALGVVFAGTPNLYEGDTFLALTWKGFLAWTSPTQTFGAFLFAPVVVLLLDLLARPRAGRDGREGRGRWVLLGLLLIAVMGGKAPYLPLLAGALAALAVVQTVRHRRPPGVALTALAMTAACLGYAQLVLFGQARQGMAPVPLSLAQRTWAALTSQDLDARPPTGTLLAVTLLLVLSWGVVWCGALGLLVRPGTAGGVRPLTRPPVLLMLGLGAVAFPAVLLIGHPHLSQLYFLQESVPYLTIAAVYGLLVLIRRSGPSWRAVAGAAAAGVAAAYLVRRLCAVVVPLPQGRPEGLLYLPYAVLAAAVGLAAVAAVPLGRPRRLRAWTLLLVAVTAAGAPAAWATRFLSFADGTGRGAAAAPAAPTNLPGPRGLFEAGRWLRDHSAPGDLVATNAHCLWVAENPCDSRHFWVSALSERRVLVEGWVYTARIMSQWHPGVRVETLPFWDRARLRLNDAAFAAPTADVIRRLRDRYGVRWLFADERLTGSRPRLGDYAELRFRSGDYAVYHVPDPAS